jgi:hypothetical protein
VTQAAAAIALPIFAGETPLTAVFTTERRRPRMGHTPQEQPASVGRLPNVDCIAPRGPPARWTVGSHRRVLRDAARRDHASSGQPPASHCLTVARGSNSLDNPGRGLRRRRASPSRAGHLAISLACRLTGGHTTGGKDQCTPQLYRTLRHIDRVNFVGGHFNVDRVLPWR